jgi:hypothetical protein
MSCESELHDLIDIGRRILHQRCEQQLCDEWRQRAFLVLCGLLGPQHEHAKLFQTNEYCKIRSLLMRAQILWQIQDWVSQGLVPVQRKGVS